MTKREMEVKLLELEKEVLELKLRIAQQQTVFVPMPYPVVQPVWPCPAPYYDPYPRITWTSTSAQVEAN